MARPRQRTYVRANRINVRANQIVTTTNWRNELSQDDRKRIVNKIMDTLQRHMPFTGPDGTNELKKIAVRFEDKVFAAAVDQEDYLRKISLKMLSLRNHVSRDGNFFSANQLATTTVESNPARAQAKA
ncbi:hypothetical protein SUGI_1016500 [Cryptomeria japonica]|nr:hypothetical protein SUGI_1016500 [Cryptomeria japonica]